MSLIKPFRALYYNRSLIRDLSKVVCPPYDIIDKEQDNFFRKASPYNFCNVLKVNKSHNYASLARTFKKWIDEEVLIEDENPYLYIYEQKFYFENKIRTRIGFLGLLRIDKKGVVLPHEYTFGAPKRDRYYMIKALKANLSPIFVIAPGEIGVLGASYQGYRAKKPIIRFTDFLNIKNRVWRISDKDTIKQIERVFSRRNLFIADGHHRFEVAYNFFKRESAGAKDANYILAYFTDSRSGLFILPTHRVVKINMPFDSFLNKLSKYFVITKSDEAYFKKSFNNAGRNRVVLGLYNGRDFYLLQLKNTEALDKIFKKDKSKAYRKLDVYVLHEAVFPNVDSKNIIYTHSLEEAMKLSGKGKISFILRSMPLESVFSMARKGYRLPQKSTYFYPKLLSGVLARRMEF